METAEKWRLEYYLVRLKQNLPDEKSLPALDETLDSYHSNEILRVKIDELANADSVSRFYAAILLSAIEKTKANSILEQLQNDKTPIVFQKSIGFGAVEIPLYLAVRDFIDGDSSIGENLSRVESLDTWKLAISMEKRDSKEHFDENALPLYEDVLEAQTDAEKMLWLRDKIEMLKNGSVAEKFYSAALLQYFDEPEARKILESLIDEPAEISVLQGDTMIAFPASFVAGDLLGRNVSKKESSENQSPLARFFKWLGA